MKRVWEAVEEASDLVRYVGDLACYGSGRAMKEAMNELKKRFKMPFSKSKLEPILDQLGSTLLKIEEQYEKFKEASENAETTCAAVARLCNNKADRESTKKSRGRHSGLDLGGHN